MNTNFKFFKHTNRILTQQLEFKFIFQRKKPNPEETPSRVSAKRRTCDRCSLGVRETVYEAHLVKCKVEPAFQRANKPKVEVPGTLSCNGKPYNYRCHLCRGLFHTYTPLLRHLAMYHFRKSLQEWQPGTNKCQYCTKVRSDIFFGRFKL